MSKIVIRQVGIVDLAPVGSGWETGDEIDVDIILEGGRVEHRIVGRRALRFPANTVPLPITKPSLSGVDQAALCTALDAIRRHRGLIDLATLEVRGNKPLQVVEEALDLIVNDGWRPSTESPKPGGRT